MKNLRRLTPIIACLLFCFLVAGCGGGDGDPVPPPPPPPTDGTISITGLNPASALPGTKVSIIYESSYDLRNPKVLISGQQVGASMIGSYELSFTVPAGAKSGPIQIIDDAKSNKVFFAISPSIVIPKLADTKVDSATGARMVVTYVFVSMKSANDTLADAKAVASVVGGTVIGQIPLISAYQVSIPAATIDEMRSIADILEADPRVDFVMTDIMMGTNADFSDYGFSGQRESNKLVQGAELYKANVSPTESGKIRPVFVSIGVLEEGVDFDIADFDTYKEKGASRYHNIGIYTKDIEGPKEKESENHGTTVVGMMAAEHGDRKQSGGNNAGFLSALDENHGGFNIAVSGYSIKDFPLLGVIGTGSVIKQTEEFLEAGAQVINWSLGVSLEGALDRDGYPVGQNRVNSKDISRMRKTFEKAFQNIEKRFPNAVICDAAGNNGNEVTPDTEIPSGIQSPVHIVVGGNFFDSKGNPDQEYNSAFGDNVDIVASYTVYNSSGNKARGTSFATPTVAAVAAAMLSIDPYLNADDIRRMLRATATPVDPDVLIAGGGTKNFTRPLTADEVGAGDPRIGYAAVLNAEGAIQAAIDSRKSHTIPVEDPVSVVLFPLKGDVKSDVTVIVPKTDVFDTVDILFLVDLSGSYSDDLATFRTRAIELFDAFSTSGKNVRIGLASFVDLPTGGFGGSGDYAYKLNLPLTGNRNDFVNAINTLSIYNGADYAEGQIIALHQAATGSGWTVSGCGACTVNPSSVGWRTGALPVIFLATDAQFHYPDSGRSVDAGYPGPTWAQTVNELNSRGIKVFGLMAGVTINDVVDISSETDAEAFALSSNSSEIVTAVLSALGTAASKVDIKLVPNGDFLGFVKDITPEEYKDVPAGESRTFVVKFGRSIFDDPEGEHVFAFTLLVTAEGVATIAEVPVTVTIK